jgi:Ca2+-binding RTX toxin-like protein
MRATVIVASMALVLGLAAVALGDTFTGTTGPDTINATDEPDVISTGFGNDTVNAGFGNDTVNTASGADFVDAGTDSAEFPRDARCPTAPPEDDSVRGGGGPDSLVGGVGDDCFLEDHDTLKGEGGADSIDVTDGVEKGSDTASGGRGNDTCYGDANDVFLSCEHVNP